MRIGRNYLFSQFELRLVLKDRERRMIEEIDGIEDNRLLNTNVEELCDYFEDEYKVCVPQIKEDEIAVEQEGTKIDVSKDMNRIIHDRSRPFYIDGTMIVFSVPFEGDKDLFHCKASTFTSNPPSATFGQGELLLTYTRTDHDVKAVRSDFDTDLNSIRKSLEWIANDVSTFNSTIRDKAKKKIKARREKLLKDQNLVAGLGFPLKRRKNAPQTYVAPTVRRKNPATARSASESTEPYIVEPVFEMKEYEHILSVISNMVSVMERSPHAFCEMKEEDIRQHFLVQLNGQYEGQATGETFNFEGKTDILIRVGDKNIFVAECKFWNGPASLKKALDQLLGYATWRDTKTAILIFNRNKDFSSVLSKIPEVIKKCQYFKKELTFNSETGFRFALRHRDDVNRELILTVLAFEVPA